MQCEHCLRSLADGETSFRVSLGYVDHYYWRTGYPNRSVGFACKPCVDELNSLSIFHHFRDAVPCHVCSRPVALTLNRKVPKIVVCSTACRTRYKGAGEKRPRMIARVIKRACEHCGETFEPSRSDARYCSAACKQAAWRRRAA